jgi:hypothetical protein
MADHLRLVAVATLNNQGAQYMRYGNFCLAARHLLQALEGTRVGIISTTIEGLDLKTFLSSLPTPQVQICSLPFQEGPSVLRSVDDGLTTIEIYGNPVDIIIAETQTDELSQDDPRFASTIMTTVVVLFNLALLSHLAGIGSSLSKNRAFLLRKSRVRYEEALQLLCLFTEEDCSISLPLAGVSGATFDLIGMAALNNLAQIYHEDSPGNNREYIACLYHLIQGAASVDTGRYGNQDLANMMELMKTIFASNAVLASISCSPVAPAA